MKSTAFREWIIRAGFVILGAFAGSLGTSFLRESAENREPVRATTVSKAGSAQAGGSPRDSDDSTGHDPAGAQDAIASRFGVAMLQSSPTKRLGDFLDTLKTMEPQDAENVRQLFARLDRQGMHFSSEWQAFYQRWGEVDPERAISHALTDPESNWAPGAMKDALRGWALRDPAAAAAWLRANEENPLFENAFIGYVQGHADRDLSAATRTAMESVPAGHSSLSKIGETLAEAAVRQGQLRGMEAWYDALPDQGDATLKRAAFRHVWWREQHAGDQQAMDWLAAQADKPWRDDQQYRATADTIARRDPAAAASWMEKLPPSPTDGTWPGLDRVVQRWMQTDPQSLETWMQSASPSAFRTAAQASYRDITAKQGATRGTQPAP